MNILLWILLYLLFGVATFYIFIVMSNMMDGIKFWKSLFTFTNINLIGFIVGVLMWPVLVIVIFLILLSLVMEFIFGF